MSLLSWWTQRVGAISVVALVALSYYVITREASASRATVEVPTTFDSNHGTTVVTPTTGGSALTAIFAYYSLFVHFLLTFFPIRACWAVSRFSGVLRKRARRNSFAELRKSHMSRKHQERGSLDSISSTETLHAGDRQIDKLEACDIEIWPSLERSVEQHKTLIHAIIIPNYKEEEDILQETLEVLASHPRARRCYDVYLGMEAREADGAAKALRLIQHFVKKFRAIDFTTHPADIPGEAPGKGSNMAWTARKLSERYPIDVRSRVIITGIDADSHLSANYFKTMAEMHIESPETANSTIYIAPIIFDRNAQKVSALVRVADIIWCAGGMSGLYHGSAISPPTSVYSLPLELVDRVGGWDCDSEAIGEDLHMYIKCFFALNGHLTCQFIPEPVSSTNVSGNETGHVHASLSDIRARYKQALRHMWGALDTGYAIRQTVEMWKNRRQTTRAFQPLHKILGDNPEMIARTSQEESENGDQSGIFSEVKQASMPDPHWENVFYLFMRLFEAHFLPVHVAVLVFASAGYLWVTDGNGDPQGLLWTFQWSKVLRTFAFSMVAVFMFLYESYHRLSVSMRHKEMARAGLTKGMDFAYRSLGSNCMDYVLFPVVAPLYGTIPSFQAVFCHLWTTDLVYTVSKKTGRQRTERADAIEMA